MGAGRQQSSGPKGRVVAALVGAACALALLTASSSAAPLSAAGLELEAPATVLAGSGLEATLGTVEFARGELPATFLVELDGHEIRRFEASGETEVLSFEPSELALGPGTHTLAVRALGPGLDEVRTERTIRAIPGWQSVIPPLVAIGLALLFKDVLLSLFLGIFAGALFLNGWNPVAAFARSIDQFIAPSMADPNNASILLFTTLLGGMVGIISKNGGTHGIVERLRGYATNARRGQLATWVMGILIFFDDYANTLIVGSTMRPITDRLRISREKLAYIVDSTAAPIASLIPISTWIGFEVGLIAAAFTALELPFNPYQAFVASIPFRFYPILALVLGFTIAFTCRDFGPMLRAERRASDTGALVGADDTPLADYDNGQLTPPEGAPRRAANALVPILTVIGVTLVGLYATGSAGLVRGDYPNAFKWLQDVFSNADSYRSLLWASLAGAAIALVLSVAQRILTVREATAAMVQGFRSMLLALAVLVLAWSLGSVCKELHTADYLVDLSSGVISPFLLPVLIFLLSAGTSFATGTSWGTMGILMPLVIPIANGLALEVGLTPTDDAFYLLLLGTISSVLAGSVWGDHCSPISDTTILSSMASGCDHIAHVRTQAPYAIAAGVVAMLVGDIPAAYGLSPWISLLLGSALLVGLVLWRGKPSAWQAGRK